MTGLEREYGWYVVGCDRLGQTALGQAEFAARWLELQAHAESLKAADASGTLGDLDARARADMESRVKDDPFVKAVLVGMAEAGV